MTGAPWRRYLVLACFCCGLLASLRLTAPSGWPILLAAGAGALATLAFSRRAQRPGAGARVAAPAVAGLALLAGLGIGDARLEAGDGQAARGTPGTRAEVRGFVATQPKAFAGATRFAVDTTSGRLGIVAGRPLEWLRLGTEVEARGRLREPEDWLADGAARDGFALELRTRDVNRLGGSRGGLTGYLDRVRARAERGISAGLPADAAALARGFVLGEDEAIDPLVRDDFRRSGLAHLLAVSGQNVMLLAVLAGLLLAALGLSPRLRLAAIIFVIGAYVPVAGAGPSIQRAGVMAAAAILAGLAGRAADRMWIVLGAVAVTLLLDPLNAGEIGWQLSFAAVIGIALWAGRIAALLESRLRPGTGAGARPVSRIRARLLPALCEAFGLTTAATVATAPLIAHHFGTITLASLPANLAVTIAVAPVMWLGMIAAAAGQLPWVPAGPVGALAGPLLDYISAVAHVFGTPGWATVSLPEPGALPTALACAALLAGMPALLAAAERRERLLPPRVVRLGLALAALLFILAVRTAGTAGGPGGPGELRPGTLRLTAVDVGQGDAILLQQAGYPAALVDTGPPGTGLGDSLRALGTGEIGALFVSHSDTDHSGAIGDVLGHFPVERLLIGDPIPEASASARIAHVPVSRVSEGSEVRIGRLRLQVLSPRPLTPGAEPPGASEAEAINARSLVLMARFGEWSALLTADAEQEATGLAPGPFDLLKVAHHGSADAGLQRLLERSAPRVALIGVGAGNRYGHPTDEVIATLAEQDVCTLRTDVDGDVGVEIGPAGLVPFAERGLDRDRPGCAP